ncbi:MAG: hypothetical protein ACRYFZ_00860 [Janthinobacterium lividum]
MAQALTPLAQIKVTALTASYDALDTVLYGVGTQHSRGNYDEATYNEAERMIQADMKALSDKVEAITGKPLAVFA